MLKRNKKNVLIGVCALAGVALTSVGFATWIVGVQRNNMDVEINTEIDSVQSDTKYLTVVAGEGAKVQIGEDTKVEKKKATDIVGVGASKAGVALYSNPLTFSFKSISLKLGVGVAQPKQLKFELVSNKEYSAEGSTVAAKNAINIVEENGVKLTNATRGTKNSDTTKFGAYNYLSYSEVVDLKFDTDANMTKVDKESNSVYTTYSFTMSSLKGKMSWGSFFDGKKPSEFYNGVYTDQTTAFNTLLDASAKANEEILTMYNAFNTGKLTISVSLID